MNFHGAQKRGSKIIKIYLKTNGLNKKTKIKKHQIFSHLNFSPTPLWFSTSKSATTDSPRSCHSAKKKTKSNRLVWKKLEHAQVRVFWQKNAKKGPQRAFVGVQIHVSTEIQLYLYRWPQNSPPPQKKTGGKTSTTGSPRFHLSGGKKTKENGLVLKKLARAQVRVFLDRFIEMQSRARAHTLDYMHTHTGFRHLSRPGN